MKIFIANISHRHGVNTYVAASEADRDNQLANYILEQGLDEWIGSYAPHDQAEIEAMSDQDLIQKYFDGHPSEYVDYSEDLLAVEVTAAARRLERARHPEWTDELFEIWWNKDPHFVEQVTNWSHFGPGTRKEHVIWEAKQVLGIE